MPKSGRCLCGACTLVLAGPHNWVGHCHCDSCRRATASPVTSFIGHPNGHWTMDGPIGRYASSDGVERGFCQGCGSPLYYRSKRYPDEVHFYATLLDDPAAVSPTVQFHAGETLPWAGALTTLPHG